MAEAYRLAGFEGTHAHKRCIAVRATRGMEARITHLREQASRSVTLTKQRALEIAAEIAEGRHQSEPQHRISSMTMIGKWCGWETGSQAEQAQAQAAGTVADLMARIRAGRP